MSLFLLATAVALGLGLGIVRIALGALSVLAGAVAAVTFAEPVAVKLSPLVSTPSLALGLGFFVVYALVLVGCSVVAWLMRRSLRALGLGWLDRLGGAGLGLGTVLPAVGLVAYLLTTRVPDSQVVKDSRFVAPIAELTGEAIERLPPSLRQRIERLAGRSTATEVEQEAR